MLGKLLKYEVKATARTFVPFYIALIAMAFINKLFLAINANRDIDMVMSSYEANPVLSGLAEIPSMLAMMGFIGIIVAIFVVTVIVMIQRFYKNLLGDEGYLMFTLPVKPWHNIVSKLTISTLWIVASSVVTALAITIVAFDPSGWRQFWMESNRIDIFQMFKDETGMSLGLVIAEIIIFSLICLIVSILHVYASIALGQLFNTHKLLASVGAYFVINVALQAISSVAMVIFGWTSNNLIDSFAAARAIQNAVILGTTINIACGAVFYIGTNWLLSKKLNLE